MAAMTPAGAVVTEAVDHALEYAKQGINDIDGPKGSGIPGGGGEDGAPEDTPEDETPETPEEPENPGNTETPAGIQHFPQGASESSFNPLPPEEQLAQLKARETAQPSRYDGDNLVAEAVSDGSGKGTIDLDSTGGKLEGEGVGIQDEVEKMDADIANDVAMAGGDKAESNIKPEQTADNLSVDAGAKALAVKEKAADVVTAIERDDKDVDAKITEFNQAASETEQLTGTAESASIEAGKEISETVGEARKMTEEAKNAVNEAKAEADANKEEEEKKDEDGGENEGDDNDSQFNSDKYPELKDLEKGDRQSIFM